MSDKRQWDIIDEIEEALQEGSYDSDFSPSEEGEIFSPKKDKRLRNKRNTSCLLYTSDAADE